MADVIEFGTKPEKAVDVDLAGLTKKVAEMFTPLEVPFILLCVDTTGGFCHTSNMYGEAQMPLLDKAKFVLLQQAVGRLNPSPMGGGLVPDASEVKQ